MSIPTEPIGSVPRSHELQEAMVAYAARDITSAEYIPVHQLGTTDDCGFSPFGDDIGTSRDTAFAKIAARIRGTELAAKDIGIN